MTNLEIAEILNEIADILEMQEIEFKPRAYRQAAQSIESLSEDVKEIHNKGGIKELKEIPGVGESIAEKIEEYIKKGKIKYHQDLKKKFPMNIEKLAAVPGLGPKTIKLLYKKLKIKNLKDLKKAAQKHKIKKIKGLGEKTEQSILEGIKIAKGTKRFLLGYIMPVAEEIKDNLKKQPFINRVEIAGSYRRKKETVGDLDILVTTKKPKLSNKSGEGLGDSRNPQRKAVEYFTKKIPEHKTTIVKGQARTSIRLKNNLQIDFRIFREKEFGSALQYFTGNKQHNITVRKIAQKKKYKLSEYGLFKKDKLIAGKTEEEIYKKLKMQTPPPEIRTNSGEVEAAQKNKLPKLVNYKDIHADLQMHSKFSDGSHSIEEMARTARELGHKIIAITDHMGPLKIAHALDEKKLKKYIKEIEKVRKKVPDINILIGAEVDIDKNGRLTATNSMLKKLDIVLAAVHSAFKQDEKTMTKRLIHAFENYPVNIFAHPTGRILQARKGYQFNLEKVFQAAKDNDIFLEANACPERLDLDGEHIRKALEYKCKFSLGTDAHNKDQLRFINLGTAMARRGWAEKKHILNTWTIKKIEKAIKK